MRTVIPFILLAACGGAQAPAKTNEPPPPPPRNDSPNMVSPEAYDDIAQAFRKRRPMVGQCYSQVVASGKLSAKARGRVTLAMKITPAGEVQNVYIPSDGLDSKELEACLMG